MKDNTILIIAGGAAVLFLGSKVVSSIFPSLADERAENRALVAATSSLYTLLDENYMNKFYKQEKLDDYNRQGVFLAKRYGVSLNVLFESLTNKCQNLDSAIGFWKDNETAVYSILGTITDRLMASLLARRYRDMYGMRLSELLSRNLNDAELATCYDSLAESIRLNEKAPN